MSDLKERLLSAAEGARQSRTGKYWLPSVETVSIVNPSLLRESAARIATLEAAHIAALELSAAVTDYRHTHDMKGDGHIETGRAWDRMRNANAKYRSSLSRLSSIESKAGGTEDSSSSSA